MTSPPDDPAIARLVEISLALLDTSAKPVFRGQHPKTHGCVRAEFLVEPGLPDALRQGVFAAPRTFPALIRFSNGRSFNDGARDIHGMAIKLLDVPGAKVLAPPDGEADTQDFVLADHPCFFLRDLAEYLDFASALLAAKRSFWGLLGLILRVKFSGAQPWRRLRDAVSPPPPSPLLARYWSQTPYALGDRPVKYLCRPDLSVPHPEIAPSRSADRLREAMIAHLAAHPARFDFLVQPQGDPAAMPVDDPTIPWDETASPPIKVATLVIPPQTFAAPAQLAFAETLAFTPWHTLPVHSPLGAINRSRRPLYAALSARRHELNHSPRREPTLADLDQLAVSPSRPA